MKPLLCLAESCLFFPTCFRFPFHIQPNIVSSVFVDSGFEPPFHLILPLRVSILKGLMFNSMTLIALLRCIKELSCIKHFELRHFPWYHSRQFNLCLNPLLFCLPSVCHIQTIPYSLLSVRSILRGRLTRLVEEFIFVTLLRYHSLLHDPSPCLTP